MLLFFAFFSGTVRLRLVSTVCGYSVVLSAVRLLVICCVLRIFIQLCSLSPDSV